MSDNDSPTPFDAAKNPRLRTDRPLEPHVRDIYLEPGYREAKAPKDFIDPLRKALRRDVDYERDPH